MQGTRVHGHHNKKKRRLVPPLQAPKPYGAGEGVALLKWRFRGLAFRLQPELEAKAGEGGLPREKGRWRERGGGGPLFQETRKVACFSSAGLPETGPSPSPSQIFAHSKSHD